jgi:hypothetical protein
MLPHVHHRPAHPVKLLIFLPVSGNVALKLLPLPFAVVLRHHSMVRAGMPEAPINEDRYLGRGEGDIRPARQEREIHPKAKPTSMQFAADE